MFVLPKPSIESVKEAEKKFDEENDLVERTLTEVLHCFPHNTDAAQVHAKVVVLDVLYKAGLREIDREPMARHIVGLGIDRDLADGSPGVVYRITHCGDLRNYYSFATKFCSWHNPAAYPIYSRDVEECLWFYKDEDHFEAFYRYELAVYTKLISVIEAFRKSYGLEALTFKQLDKFLWQQGKQLLEFGRPLA